jgi:histidine phosphotransferase ChpT
LSANLQALVSSLICHDLISSVGAIGNGVELLAERTKTMPEIGLIADSVASANGKLQFFRICFGKSAEGMIGGTAAGVIAKSMIGTPRLQLDWQLNGLDFPRDTMKLLYLVLLCAETALPIGGIVTVSATADRFRFIAEGARIAVDQAWDASHDPTPAQIQFPLARELLEAHDVVLAMTSDEERLTITL